MRLGGCSKEREEMLCEVVVTEMIGCEDGLDALWGEEVFWAQSRRYFFIPTISILRR